jgi:hypothetical protein
VAATVVVSAFFTSSVSKPADQSATTARLSTPSLSPLVDLVGGSDAGTWLETTSLWA